MPEEQEGSTEDDFRAASPLSFFHTVVFLFWQRGSCRVEKVKTFPVLLLLLCFPPPAARRRSEQCFFLGFFVGVFLPPPLLVLSDTEGFSSPLVPAPPLLSHNPLLRSFSFSFFRCFSFSVPGIDRVTRQQWGSQFRPRSLSTPWMSASTLFAPNGFIK